MSYLAGMAVLSALSLTAQTYRPITGAERAKWFSTMTYGPVSLFATGPLVSGWRTMRNVPSEWGPGWEGFGKRYGSRLVNNTVENGLEAGLGAVWGEDPRYTPRVQGPVKARIGQAFKQTFFTRYRDGRYHLGAARAASITGAAFAQKIWMPASVSSTGDCLFRVGSGYFTEFASNLLLEFGSDVRKRLRKKKR